jgi:pyrrolidone-carboxylate peptidase
MALTLRPSKIGTVRLPFEKVDMVCQIGDDLTKDQSMYVLVVGKKPGQQQQTTALVCVDYRQSVLIVSDDFKPFTDLTKNKTVKSLTYVQTSKKLLAVLENDEMVAMQWKLDGDQKFDLKLSEESGP